MPYKQPYKQVSKNDGASAVGAIATIGALIAKLGTAAKAGATAAKTAGTVAKGVKGAKTVSTAAKTAKSAKGSKLLGKASDAGKKVLDKGKKALDKGKEVVEKGKEVYDKGAQKVADATGFDKQNIKDFGAEKGQEAYTAIEEKIKSGSEPGEEPTAPSANPSMPAYSRSSHESKGSYADPAGPSMFDFRKDHGPSFGRNVNYANSNHGASQPNASNDNEEHEDVTNLNSLDKWNLWKNTDAQAMWQSYSAPITIKGVTFDAADAIRLGIMGGKLIDKGIKKHKANKWAKEELNKKPASNIPGSGVLKSSINTEKPGPIDDKGNWKLPIPTSPTGQNVKVPVNPTKQKSNVSKNIKISIIKDPAKSKMVKNPGGGKDLKMVQSIDDLSGGPIKIPSIVDNKKNKKKTT